MKPRFLIHKITSLRATAQTRAGLSELALSGIVNRDKEGRKHCSLLVSALLIFNFAFLLLLSSCISEDLQPSDPSNPPADESFTEITLPGYIAFKINTGDSFSSRADDKPSLGNGFEFNDGISSEYALAPGSDHHFILFFNTNGSVKAIVPLELSYDGLEGETNNVTLIANKVITSSSLEEGLKEEEQIIEFLTGAIPYTLVNFDRSTVVETTKIKPTDTKYTSNYEFFKSLAEEEDEEKKFTKTDFLSLTLSKYFITVDNVNKDFFTMSLSRISNENWAAVINENGKISRNKNEAIAYPYFSIYVERVATKVSLIDNNYKKLVLEEDISLLDDAPEVKVFDGLSEDFSYKSQPKAWGATLLGYGMNGLEPTCFLLKSLKDTNYFRNYSDPTNFRSYWGEDTHYKINPKEYPFQYRPALDDGTVQFYGKGDKFDDNGEMISFTELNDKYVLGYKAFKDLYMQEGNSGVFYPLENTYDDSAEELGERGYFTASTHLLALARLHIEGFEPGTDFYRDQNGIFYERDRLLDAKMTVMQKKALVGGNSGLRVLYTNWQGHQDVEDAVFITISWNPGDKLYVKESNKYREVIASDFTLIPAEITGGDGQVLIAPANISTQMYLGQTTQEGEEKYSELDYNRVVSLFYALMGPVDYYKEGMMYYAAAIPHARIDIVPESWKTVGHIGILRNNWYQIKIEGISAPGVSVQYEKQPIIPMMDIKLNYLNLSVEIINWHDIIEDEIGFY